MERLVTTSQAAAILGISLQGVHYRIKNNQLKSLKQGGKSFVYISDELEKKIEHNQETLQDKKEHTEQIITLKDEQISLLKKSMKWLRRQHKDEIKRIEENQKRIISVFNSEIKLLQGAFNEMRSIYKPQLENRQGKNKYISLEDFSLFLKSHNKSNKDIKITILKAIQKDDPRFVFNKQTRKVLILNEDFSDLL